MTLEILPLRDLPVVQDAADDVDAFGGDDEGRDDEGEDEGDEDRHPGVILWRSLWNDPEQRAELDQLVRGVVVPSASKVATAMPSMPPMPCNVVHRVARLTQHDASDIADGRSTPRPGVMDETTDRLCVIEERSGLLVLEVGLEWHVVGAGPSRIVLPISSGMNILPGTQAQITSRPQNSAVRLRRLIIGGTPADWVVNDIRVGNRSQFSQSGDIPGELFASNAMGAELALEVVQTSMDLVMIVTYVGSNPEGASFTSGWICDIADEPTRPRHRRRLAVRWTPVGRQQGWMVGRTGEDADLDLLVGRTFAEVVRGEVSDAPGEDPVLEGPTGSE